MEVEKLPTGIEGLVFSEAELAATPYRDRIKAFLDAIPNHPDGLVLVFRQISVCGSGENVTSVLLLGDLRNLMKEIEEE